jgi:phage terminase Nu1 subunit (DNA packaging protein)
MYIRHIRHLHRALAARGLGEQEIAAGANLRLERHRLIKAQVDLQEMEVLERRRFLIPVHVYEQHLSNFVITTRQRLLALPARFSRLVAGLEPHQIRETIDREIRDLLVAWSRKRLEIFWTNRG